MFKKLFLIIFSLLITQNSFALDIVYPKKNIVTINSPSTFFIGSADTEKELTINGGKVDIHLSGGFAYTVKLNFGENKFSLKSGDDIKVYTIYRPKKSAYYTQKNSSYIAYNKTLYAITKNDNVPLRSTPINEGINRMAHLQKDIPLIIIGEKNGFYKVFLGEKTFGWLLKNNVEKLGENIPNKILNSQKYIKSNEYDTYIFNLSDKTPWEISEIPEGLRLKLFNIKNSENGIYTEDFDIKKMFKNKNLIGYQAYFDDNNFYLKIRRPLTINKKKPLKGIKIAIDAGHGGNEIGAISCLGLEEKSFNLEYAKDLKKILTAKGAEVFMTRDTDKDLGLYERVKYTNDNDIPIFISLHGNALPDTANPLTTYGTEIYYYYNQSKPLAGYIMASLLETGEIKNNGIKQASFAVIRNTNALALLIEIGYLINPAENAKISSEKFRKNAVKAIADGIEKYIESQK